MALEFSIIDILDSTSRNWEVDVRMVQSGIHTFVERKIQFFRMYVGNNAAEVARHTIDYNDILEEIYALPFSNDDDGRYLFDDEGNALCAIDARISRPALIFSRVRRTGLPLLEDRGRMNELDLDATTGLLEPIHVMMFPDNVVGAEYNHYGPRITSLGQYLSDK